MKSKKLNLKNLEIQSFVTSLEPALQETLKGGAEIGGPDVSKLPTMPCNCSEVDGCVTAWHCTNVPAVC
jgi:hypothetical protein